VTYNLRTDYVPQEDIDRLKIDHPEVELGHYDYCPTCKKTGSYFWQGKNQSCDCEYQLQLYKHYLNSGIGATYQELDWSDWYADPELANLFRYTYLEKPFVERGMGMFLWGDFGTGKTMLATLVLKDLIKRGKRCYAITVEALIDEFTKGWGSDEDKRWYERRVKNAEVLLLDELGKERNRGALAASTVDNLLRHRVDSGKPTLITTNWDPKYIGIEYGGPALRRIYEKSLAQKFVGTDVSSDINARNISEVMNGITRPII
jgi:DNA replication protein DnaC